MKTARFIVFLVAAVLFAPPLNAMQYRSCQVYCMHRVHQYDVVPCSHPCYGVYGPFPCHSLGDAVPCIHPVHAWDVIPC
jgi:hypothetical protein